MKLPLRTTSAPLVGKEARRVINAVNAGRAATNARAKMFAAEIVAEMRCSAAKRRKSPVARHA
jgi:hypothetical protein